MLPLKNDGKCPNQMLLHVRFLCWHKLGRSAVPTNEQEGSSKKMCCLMFRYCPCSKVECSTFSHSNSFSCSHPHSICDNIAILLVISFNDYRMDTYLTWAWANGKAQFTLNC